MPVIRTRTQLNDTRSITGGGVRPSPMPQAMLNMANALSSRAADLASTMGQTSQEEAIALAKSATFSTGPDGMPQLPPEPAERMGLLASRAYDRTIEQNFLTQMQTAVRAQIEDAKNTHPYDLDAFQAEVGTRVDAMADDVPEGYEAAWQNIFSSELVRAGASIGYAQSKLQENIAKSTYGEGLTMRTQSITEAILLSDDELANAMIEDAVNYILNSPEHITMGRSKTDINNIILAAGTARLKRDERLDERGSADIQAMLDQANMGGDILDYYNDPFATNQKGEHIPVDGARGAAVAILNQFLGSAYARDQAVANTAKTNALLTDLQQGRAADTPENRNGFDAILGASFGLRDAEGSPASMNADYILAISQGVVDQDPEATEMFNTLTQRIKDAGIYPESVVEVARQLNRRMSAEDFIAAYPLYTALKERTNSDAANVDMSAELGPEALVVMQMVDAMHMGGRLGTESVEQAVVEVLAYRDEPWTASALAEAMNRDTGFFRLTNTTEDNAFERLEKATIDHVFDGVNPTDEEREKAVQVAQIYYRLEGTRDAALERTRQAFEGGWMNSDYMGKARTATAPEIAYKDPAPLDFGGVLKKYGKILGSRALRGLENILKAGNFVWGDLLIEDRDIDLGSREMGSTLFDQLANAEIKRMLEEHHPEMLEMYDMFLTHEDYQLGFREGGGKYPIYDLRLKGPMDTMLTFPEPLDIREAYMEAVSQVEFVIQMDEALMNYAINQSTNWEVIIERLQEGKSPAQQDIMREVGEAMAEQHGITIK